MTTTVPDTAVREQTVTARGLTSHVLTAGNPDAQAVLLMHGAGPGANAAANWLHLMPDLAENYFVVAPDLIGFGKSVIPDPFPANIMAWIGIRVEQVVGLMDHFGIERAHIVGNSMGGALTLQLLSEVPGRFDRVLLMGSIGAPVKSTPELQRLLSFYNDPRPARYREMMHTFAYDPENFVGMDKIIADRYEIAMNPEVRAIAEKMIGTMRDGINSLAMPPSVLAKLPHEVLILHGRQDRIIPLDTSLYLLEHLQHVSLSVIDKSGHWLQLERWDVMRPLLENHFGLPDRG